MGKKKIPPIAAVDLFCGAGGLTYGLNLSKKIRVYGGIDIDPICEYPFTHNNSSTFIEKDISKVSSQEVMSLFPKEKGLIRLLAGCAPCQTFSRYNPKASSTDKRWELLKEFERLINDIKPELVTMENVPGLRKTKVFEHFVTNLKKHGYKTWFAEVHCEKYGLPQHRTRLVLLGSRLGPIELLTPDQIGVKITTVKEAIGKLPPIKAGEVCKSDSLHRTRALSAINIARIQHSIPGGTWRDWPEELKLECHTRQSGQTYPSVYGRIDWDAPGPTITTQFYGLGNGRFGHPEQDRALSLREGAILQGFPEKYEFVPENSPISVTAIGRLIGNAVPVRLGEVIGKSLVAHVKQVLSTNREKDD